MPYSIEPMGGKFQVVDADGNAVGEPHNTRKQATTHLRALYANVPDSKDTSEPASLVDKLKALFNKPDMEKKGRQAAMDYLKGKGIDDPTDEQIANATEELLTEDKEGKRNSNPDLDRLQQIHDLSVLNGAACAFSVKEVDGKLRWILFSSNSFQDRDHEIISQAALEADVERTDKEASGNYGPLRWWHLGSPDTFTLSPGPGVDLGDCDYRAMSGRVLIESGTFRNERVGRAIQEKADTLAASIGYFHPRSEPDSEGVYHKAHEFERSLLPRGKASNMLTALTVKGDQDMATSAEKEKQLADLLGDPALAASVIQQAEQTEKAATESGLKYKEQQTAQPTGESTADAQTTPAASEVETKEPSGTPTAVPSHGPEGLFKAFGLEAGDDEATCKEKIGQVLGALIDARMSAGAKEASEKEAGVKAQIADLDKAVKELQGDLPRGVRGGFRASLSDATINQRIDVKQGPEVSPMDSAIDQLMGLKQKTQ